MLRCHGKQSRRGGGCPRRRCQLLSPQQPLRPAAPSVQEEDLDQTQIRRLALPQTRPRNTQGALCVAAIHLRWSAPVAMIPPRPASPQRPRASPDRCQNPGGRRDCPSTGSHSTGISTVPNEPTTNALRACHGALLSRSRCRLHCGSQGAALGDRWLLRDLRGHDGGMTQPADETASCFPALTCRAGSRLRRPPSRSGEFVSST